MNLRKLMSEPIRRNRLWLLAGAALMLLSVTAGLLLLGLSGWFITASALAGMGLLAGLDIFTPGAGIRLAAITRTLSRYGERLATHQATFRMLADLRLNLFTRLLRLDEIQLRRIRRGDSLTRLTADIETLDHLFVGVLAPVVTAVLLTLAVATVFALFGAVPAMLAIIGLLGAGAAGMAATGRIGTARSQLLGRLEPKLRMLATEGLEGLETLRAFDRIGWQQRRIRRLSGKVIGLHTSLARVDALGQGLITLVGLVGVWIVLVAGLWLHHNDQLSAPVTVLMVLVTLGLTEAWQPLPSAWRRLVRCRVAAGRVGALASQEPVLPVPREPLDLPENNGMVLERITFGYHQRFAPVIADFSLEIDSEARIAITGPSGGGKTTLALLMMRQIDPDVGRVLLGGRDLRELDPTALRQRIGYLPQRPVIFRDSLAANLRLGCPDADEDRLVTALGQAGLEPFLSRLPRGLATWLDEAGANVSGGELRRIALARLILTDPGMVILDEPTTGLDRESAANMATGLDRWLAGRTAIMIGHDPNDLPAHERVVRIGTEPGLSQLRR